MRNKLRNKYIISLKCIDEGNSWGLKYDQCVWFKDKNGVTAFTTNEWEATLFNDKRNLSGLIEKIIDEGDFTPFIRVVHLAID